MTNKGVEYTRYGDCFNLVEKLVMLEVVLIWPALKKRVVGVFTR
ncbi:hypothetical protein MICH65_0270 [Candidatus Chazhemtobacterium aquaticus]|uniref:Uncharacterized protein n=1 Tax=Candidatus Chazhemtobacterium aquaticus TaxID=2715735 RepID=A0A857NCL2_9BACT|nr:hypothetical protein MICH65_0270 [Candidatus Chazhemtobacterium aquaticus]